MDTSNELGGKTSTFNIKWQLAFPVEEAEEDTNQTEEGAGS